MDPSRMIHALRSSVVLPVLVLALTPLACSQGKPSDGEQAAPEKPIARALPGGDDGLIVYEWGTFTSMAGSDGASLEGLHHAADALPPLTALQSQKSPPISMSPPMSSSAPSSTSFEAC